MPHTIQRRPLQAFLYAMMACAAVCLLLYVALLAAFSTHGFPVGMSRLSTGRR